MKKYSVLLAILLILFTARTVSAENSFTIKTGWNLVSADVINSLEKNSGGFADLLQNGGAIFALNPADKKYYGGSNDRKNVEDGIEKMFQSLPGGDDLVPALGWWIYSTKTIPVSINFDLAENDVLDYQQAYKLNKGWNLVGMSGVVLGKSLSDIAGSCEFVSVYHYERNTFRKQTEADLKEKITPDSLGYALAIKVAKDCRFDFAKSGAAQQIPSLPE